MSQIQVTVEGPELWSVQVLPETDYVVEVQASDIVRTIELIRQGPQGPVGPQGIQGVQGDTGPQGPQGPAGTSFEIPEVSIDPISPSSGDMWVKRSVTAIAPIVSHTLLQIGLTAPGESQKFDYVLKYRTQNGSTVVVALS